MKLQALRRRLREDSVERLVPACSRLLGSLSWRGAQRAGKALGRLYWWLGRRDRRRAFTHLEVAFPQWTSGERRTVARACFLHLGTTLAESLHLLEKDCSTVSQVVRIEGWERVAELRAARRPILILTAHCGNWELVGAGLNCRGLGMAAIVRGLDEPGMQRHVFALRSRFGTETIERGTPGAPRKLLQVFRGGRALAMLIDQDTGRVEGTWVPFFGRLAWTPVGAAKIALRQRAVVLPVFVERLTDGSHLLRIRPPLQLSTDPQVTTARMTEAIEEQIRRRPEQWVWMHRRWRRRPESEEAS
jgi:KDO2-lipid IV(A) lauroyltransferase